MPMTLGQMVATVTANCDGYGVGAYFDTSAVKRYLNAAQLDLALLSSRVSYDRVYHPAGESDFTLPGDCLVVKEVVWEDENGERTRLKLSDRYVPPTVAAGTPSKYMQKDGTTFSLFPVPQVSGYIAFGYIWRPPEMVSDDDVATLEDVDGVLVAYATWRCLLDAGSVSEAREWHTAYLEERSRWMSADFMKAPRRMFIELDEGW